MGKSERRNQLSRCVSLMTALAPHIVSGLSVTELSQKAGLPASVVCRDMEELRAVGWAEKLESGRWSLTTKPISCRRLRSGTQDCPRTAGRFQTQRYRRGFPAA